MCAIFRFWLLVSTAERHPHQRCMKHEATIYTFIIILCDSDAN